MKTLAQIYAELNKDQSNRLTNKCDFEHGGYFRSHIDLYEEILAPLRQRARHVVEIGVNKGGSIMMWAEYFPKAQIYGLDSSKYCIAALRERELDRVVPLRVNQNDREAVQRFSFDYGAEGFDVVIDDGSHYWEDQIKTFEILWPCMNDGGIFVVEDTLNSYYYKEGNTGISAVDYFKRLVDRINFYGSNEVLNPDDIQSTIGWIGFRYNAVFIKKQFMKHVS